MTIIRVTDDTPRTKLEGLLHSACHKAKRQMPRVGSDEQPTGWDRAHELMNDLLDDLEQH